MKQPPSQWDPSAEWEELIGRSILRFGDIEYVSVMCLSLIPTDKISDAASELSFARRASLLIEILEARDNRDQRRCPNSLIATRLARRMYVAPVELATLSTGSLVLTVVLSCIGINIVAADQYISIVLPGKMYKAEFEKRNLDAKNLSRIIEDSGTLTSPLVPWNTCGAYMAATLGVATLAYLPFVFFNLINPVVSVIYGYTGFTITRMGEAAEPVTA